MSKKDKGIPLSPKHGVNPTLLKCFWCGGANRIALLGQLKGDAEAPHETVLNLEPCDQCKVLFARGVHAIKVSEDGSRFNGNATFGIKGEDGVLPWPTGRYAVLKAKAVKGGKPGGKILVDKFVMDRILGPDKKKGNRK